MATKLVQIQCRGRRPDGLGALPAPIDVTVEASRSPDSDTVSVGPTDCPYNTGGHSQRCKASHPDQDKVGEGVLCPFSFDYPYALQSERWQMPNELLDAVQELYES